MAPVIAWVEALIGRHVCVTFSIDVRDVNLAQLLQVGHSQSSHHAPPTLLTLVQRNHNGIVSDIISALHKLITRSIAPTCYFIFFTYLSFSPVAGALPEDFHGSTVIYNRPILPSDVVDGGVAIAVFERETSKGSINSSEPIRKLCVFPSLASSTSMCV